MAVTDPTTAYFDESRVDGAHPFPVVAGFCNTYDVWEVFEKKWKEVAGHIPARDQKKYLRIRSSENWSSGDERRYKDSLTLAGVMRDFTLWPIFTTIERAYFQPVFDAIAKAGIDAVRDHPLVSSAYSVCSFMCCELLDNMAAQRRFNSEWTPIKVVFDKGNADERWLDAGYRGYYSQKRNTYLKQTPIFGDDDDLIPLRAADAYAWLLSRKYNQNDELEQLRIIHDSRQDVGRQELVITSERARSIMESLGLRMSVPAI